LFYVTIINYLKLSQGNQVPLVIPQSKFYQEFWEKKMSMLFTKWYIYT